MTVGVLANLLNPAAESQRRDEQEAAARLGVQLVVVKATTESEFEPAFARLSRERAGALLVAADSFFNSRREKLVALSARHPIPAIYEFREFAEAGGDTRQRRAARVKFCSSHRARKYLICRKFMALAFRGAATLRMLASFRPEDSCHALP
jgi:hypothetical protein